MRVVLDTNILIRAHERGASRARQLLDDIQAKQHRLVISNEIISEVTRVLRYPRLQELYRLSDTDLLNYAQFLQSISDVVILTGRYLSPLRDPSDMHILETADVGNADVLCSADGDFFDQTLISFCAGRGIEVCDEVTLAQRLR